VFVCFVWSELQKANKQQEKQKIIIPWVENLTN
jgi:hypothetical protein